MTFGEKLQKLRKARAWTQEELAQQLGVSRQSLSKWESDAALPDTANVVALSDLFGVSTDYLLRDAAQEAPAAVPAIPAPAAPQKLTPRTTLIVGSIMVVLGMLLWLPMRIMSIVNPVDLHIMDGNDAGHYTGIQGFIRSHDLELPYYAGIALLVIGVVSILVPFVLEWVMNRKNKEHT